MLRVHSRGSSILEFVMTLPFTILLLFITLDTGKAVFVKTSLQSAAATAAANGARSGFIGDSTTVASCDSVSSGEQILKSFCNAAPWAGIGAKVTSIKVTMVSASNEENANLRYCTKAFPYVQVQAEVSLENMLTPTIDVKWWESAALFKSVSVESAAYCEVYRE